MTEEEVREDLRLALQVWKSQRQYAASIGVSEQYIADILKGRRSPGPAVLSALGLKKIVTYEREKDGV